MPGSAMSESNQRYWDSLASVWQALRDQDQLWRQILDHPDLAFEGEVLAFITRYAGDLHGKLACVIGSGDNYAAFALAGLGAQVTSTDISDGQLEIASQRARQLGLEIAFVRADAATLEGIADEQFDLVVSTNGFFVWIADPLQVFQQIRRVLKHGGFYIFYDIHPFLRPWKDQVQPLEMEKPYTATGPFDEHDHDLPSLQFHWRLSDLLNPLLEAGLVLRQIAESPPDDPRFWEGFAYAPGEDQGLMDWRNNPRAGLPAWLSVAAQK